MNELFIDDSELKIKQSKLENARVQLKREFFGIDEVIDKVLNMISSWYAMPQLQTKPLIINLWGMTGIGKTSLVERMAQLLEVDDKHYSFDLGDRERSNGFSLRNTLEEIYKIQDDSHLILSFDEFQHARTINEKNHEITNSTSRIVWDILGSGRFSFDPAYHELFELSRYLKFMKYQVTKGIKVVNGEVVDNPKKYEDDHEKASFIYSSITQETSFFSVVYLESLFALTEKIFSSQLQLTENLLTMSAQETVEFLTTTLSQASCKKEVDCSKALVFIIGNLDEAYSISGNFNPDISADIYYEETKKITLSRIKKVLRRRFRNEQISRLGNNHVIYPSLSANAFNCIIRTELEKSAKLIKEKYRVELDFDDSVIDLIYKEGVFPTQGARPLHTTIDNIIGSNLSKILYYAVKEKIKFDYVKLSCADEKLISEYYLTGLKKGVYKIDLVLLTENRRKSSNDDIQTITAVHESGHAILLKVLLDIDPDGIISVGTDENQKGMTLISSQNERIISKQSMIFENAVNLGGLIAEKLVFGEENVTSGSISDFEDATQTTSVMIKKAGMGQFIGSFDIDNNFRLTDHNNDINKEIGTILKESYEKAEKVLTKNFQLLIKLAEYLSRNSFMNKDTFRKYFDRYAIQSTNNTQKNIYKNRLHEKLANINQLKLTFTGTDN